MVSNGFGGKPSDGIGNGDSPGCADGDAGCSVATIVAAGPGAEPGPQAAPAKPRQAASATIRATRTRRGGGSRRRIT
jgi:hypothetical protein